MRGAIQIAKLFGIPVFLHWSFGLVLVGIFYLGQSNELSLTETLWMGLLFMIVFVCVVMHEYGHALSARYYGVSTHDIILTPIGGIARLNGLPDKPIQEFVIAIAGPLVNVLISLLLAVYLFLLSDKGIAVSGSSLESFSRPANFIPILFYWNFFLALFNLVPAFPMDGGRIFRSLLSLKFGRLKATKYATYLGQLIAVAFLVGGVLNSDYLIAFIGLFVFFTASRENKMAILDDRLSKSVVADFMRPRFTRLRENDGVAVAIHELRQGLEKSFLVFDENDQLTGVVHQQQIKAAQQEGKIDQVVGEFMMERPPMLSPNDNLRLVFQTMQKNNNWLLPVASDGAIVGVIDVRMMNELLSQ
ncbi:MAG: M50 family metallopeptidase [Bacteroidota bacterium]